MFEREQHCLVLFSDVPQVHLVFLLLLFFVVRLVEEQIGSETRNEQGRELHPVYMCHAIDRSCSCKRGQDQIKMRSADQIYSWESGERVINAF